MVENWLHPDLNSSKVGSLQDHRDAVASDHAEKRDEAFKLESSGVAAGRIERFGVGPNSQARGLRHSFGVNAALRHVPETRIQKWLGHANLATTAIYLDMAALEDREMAQRMWWERPPARDGPMPEAAGGADPPGAETGVRVVTEAELLRLVSAYSAIPEAGRRLALLTDIETTAGRPRA